MLLVILRSKRSSLSFAGLHDAAMCSWPRSEMIDRLPRCCKMLCIKDKGVLANVNN